MGDRAAYNPRMFEAMSALAERSVLERVVLIINHVVRAEPEAMRRLALHTGKTATIQFDHWPVVLPAPPSVVLGITPAGLVERIEAAAAPLAPEEPVATDLRIRIDAANPARSVARWFLGDRPEVAIEGDAELATEMSWLADNLRWDVEEDLSRMVGDAPAHAIVGVGGAVARGLRDAAQKVDRAIDTFARGRGP